VNEADTRAELIDKQLEVAGWKTGGDVRVFREFNINDGEIKPSGIRFRQLKADYVLAYKNIKLAVVEAKSDEVEVGEGVAQAKLYANKLRLQSSFAANGKSIYQINHQSGEEGLISSFPTPEELWQLAFSDVNEWRDKFNAVPFESINGTKQPRYYQELAVNRAVEAIAIKKPRVLLNLATGTGKTFIAFQIAWKLFKSRWTLQRDGKRQPRILFLADRNILANQAYLDFGAFDQNALVRIEPQQIAAAGDVPRNGSVFFTIFQTFMSGQDGKPYFGKYEKDFFDLIIIDECHRGGANDESTWRDILNHFSDAVHLGLTATPKRKDNADTYDYFGEPVFKYSLKEGVEDGFLTPFKVKRIQSTIDEYVYTHDDEVIEGEVKEGKVYTESDFNRTIVIEARERKRVQDMLANINKDEKTIVFCANQAHAALIRELINQEVKPSSADYCVRVTANDGSIGDMHLRNFQDNARTIPTILTTSQKLTTGVDARNVRNVVLFRPINSMIEFKQIIGRGTRLFEGKNYFTILDFVGAYHLFSDPEWDGEPIEPEPPEVIKLKEPVDVLVDPPREPIDEEDRSSKVKIRLADGKEREIQTMTSTLFYVDGRPIAAEEFFKRIFNILHLPEFFGTEEQLRKAWANPLTRKQLLVKLESAGCSRDDLEHVRKMINAQDSDLFDVLEYVSYAKKPITRKERAESAKPNIHAFLEDKDKDFIDFVLSQYIAGGESELDVGKLSTLIQLKYTTVYEGVRVLGDVDAIQKTFVDFQKHLYL
jgi:type I restriction enzyme R subunit